MIEIDKLYVNTQQIVSITMHKSEIYPYIISKAKKYFKQGSFWKALLKLDDSTYDGEKTYYYFNNTSKKLNVNQILKEKTHLIFKDEEFYEKPHLHIKLSDGNRLTKYFDTEDKCIKYLDALKIMLP